MSREMINAPDRNSYRLTAPTCPDGSEQTHLFPTKDCYHYNSYNRVLSLLDCERARAELFSDAEPGQFTDGYTYLRATHYAGIRSVEFDENIHELKPHFLWRLAVRRRAMETIAEDLNERGAIRASIMEHLAVLEMNSSEDEMPGTKI